MRAWLVVELVLDALPVEELMLFEGFKVSKLFVPCKRVIVDPEVLNALAEVKIERYLESWLEEQETWVDTGVLVILKDPLL